MILASIGAGVQSSTLGFMCDEGYLPYKIDAGIFADTQAEPPEVYRWLDWLEKQVSFPIYRVTKGNLAVEGLERRVAKNGVTYWKNSLPFFVATPVERRVFCEVCGGEGRVGDSDGTGDGGTECRACAGVGKIGTGDFTTSVGKINRKCTVTYKIEQIVRKSRELVGGQKVIRAWRRQHGVKSEKIGAARRWVVPPGTPRLVRTLIGISLDEIQRVKPSREPWIEHVHPLVDARITRQDCLNWMQKRGYPKPPRSACVFCPFHSDAEWLRMKREDPESFAIAAQFEAAAAAAAAAACEITRGVPYLHRSLKPLPLVTFREELTGDLFGNECEGMCGS